MHFFSYAWGQNDAEDVPKYGKAVTFRIQELAQQMCQYHARPSLVTAPSISA